MAPQYEVELKGPQSCSKAMLPACGRATMGICGWSKTDFLAIKILGSQGANVPTSPENALLRLQKVKTCPAFKFSWLVWQLAASLFQVLFPAAAPVQVPPSASFAGV